MENRYIRLTKSLNDKGLLIKPEEIQDLITPDKDYYCSTYYYNQSHYDKFQETKTIRGIQDVVTDKIWFDFDNKVDPSLAQQDAIEVINRLKKYSINEKDIEIYFSGNKGFNVVITVNKTLTPNEVYDITVNKFAKNLKTFDTSLYDASQIMRVPGTKHQVTGLYKIPLSFESLKKLNINQIKVLATNLENIEDEFEWNSLSLEENFYKIEVDKKEKTKSVYSVDLSNKPPQWKNCKWSLLQGNFPSGKRHDSLLIIAATCRGLGYDKDTTYYMCKSALKKQSALTGTEEFPKEELWNNIIEQTVFKDNWEGGQYTCKKPGWLQEYCKSLGEHSCKDHSEDEDNFKVLEAEDLINSFDSFVKNFDENRILTGIPSIDQNLVITIGQPVAILAAPSVGKTSLLLNILHNVSQDGIHSMFFSLDMYNALITQKLLHKVSKLNFGRLKELILNNPTEAVKYYNKVKEGIKNVHTVIQSGVTVSDMKNIIKQYEQDHGVKIKVVAVDYLELIGGPYSEELANSAHNAKKLRDLAVDLGICLIVLTQPQKSAKPDEPITSYRQLKGASLLEQSFRIIMSMYRPGFSPEHPEDDRFVGLNCVKNTMGPLFSTHLHFDGLTGDIRELTEEELGDLRALLKSKKEAKEDKGEWQ